MAFLLQCLRDIRTWTGDLDLPPPAAGDGFLGAHLLPRSCDEMGDASSHSECDEARLLPGRIAGRFAQEVHRDTSSRPAPSSSSYAATSPLEPA